MATAEELLRSIATQPNPEGHIVVGGDRFITVPENLKRLAVQYDHNMETVTFDCPRYWDNRDMSQMAVYINYMRSDKYPDRYPVDNVRADGDIMHFDWTISRNVTEIPGAVSFLVCVMKTDAEGNEERHWNSELCQECYISAGMETEEHPALEYPDEVTQLLLRMATVEQINVQAEEMRSLRDEVVAVAATAEETKNQALDASGQIRNSYANAIKNNVSGEVIRVDDVSPLEHDVKCLVRGKNLFDISKVTNTNQATNNGDGTITIAQNVYYCRLDQKLRDVCPQLRAGDTAILSFDTTSPSTPYMYFHGLQGTWYIGQVLTLTDAILDSNVTIYGYPDNVASYGQECIISNIQIEIGTVSTEYESYIDPETVFVSRVGKNLFNISVIGSQGSVTNNGDGSVTVTASTSQPVEKFGEICPALKAGDVATLSFISENKDQNFIYLVGSKESWHNGTSKVLTQNALDGVMYFYSKKDTDGNGVATRIWDIQVEIGETVSTYESYVEAKSETPVLDGTVDITSVSPTMTLFTDTPGVTIEAEYNVDTKTYVDNLPGASDEDIANAVENYLEENPVQAVDLDTTLSKSGQAADAKAVGDQLGSIETALDSIIEIQESLIGGDGA